MLSYKTHHIYKIALWLLLGAGPFISQQLAIASTSLENKEKSIAPDHSHAIVSVAYKDNQGHLQVIARGALIHPNIVLSMMNLWHKGEHYYYDYDYSTSKTLLYEKIPIEKISQNKHILSLPLFVIFQTPESESPQKIIQTEARLQRYHQGENFSANFGAKTNEYIKHTYAAFLRLKSPHEISSLSPLPLASEGDAWTKKAQPPGLFAHFSIQKKDGTPEEHKYSCSSKHSKLLLRKTNYIPSHMFSWIIPYIYEYTGDFGKTLEERIHITKMFPFSPASFSHKAKCNQNGKCDLPQIKLEYYNDIVSSCAQKSCAHLKASKHEYRYNDCHWHSGSPILAKDTANTTKLLGLQYSTRPQLTRFSNLLASRLIYKRFLKDLDWISHQDIDAIFGKSQREYMLQKHTTHKEQIASIISHTPQHTTHICRGTLIERGVLITAAHCVDDGDGKDASFVSFKQGQSSSNYKVQHIVLHPRYNPPHSEKFSSGLLRYDIALVFFEDKSTLNIPLMELIPSSGKNTFQYINTDPSVLTRVSSLGLRHPKTSWPNTYEDYFLMQARYHTNLDEKLQDIQTLLNSYAEYKHMLYWIVTRVTARTVEEGGAFYHKLSSALKKRHAMFSSYCRKQGLLCLEAHPQYHDFIKGFTVCRGDSGGPVLWSHKQTTMLIAITTLGGTGLSSPSCSNHSASVLVQPHLQWIRAEVQKRKTRNQYHTKFDSILLYTKTYYL